LRPWSPNASERVSDLAHRLNLKKLSANGFLPLQS
jgi:hypothetical protein